MSHIDDDTGVTDEDLYEVWAVDNALDADKDDPFAGDDPTDDYLEEESTRRYLDHCDRDHGGSDCDCPPVAIPLSDRSPF